jgi:hypothetical protein
MCEQANNKARTSSGKKGFTAKNLNKPVSKLLMAQFLR